MKYGVDLNMEDDKGWLVLYYVLRRKDFKCVVLLMIFGVNIYCYIEKRI